MNICILLIDCLRPDHLGCYGYQRKTSPNIDAIAENGVLFENGIAQANWTYPSVNSMISGRYPSVLQLSWIDQRINRNFPVLPEFLSERGYHTAIFSNFKVLLSPNSFSSHFKEKRNLKLNEDTLSVFKDWIGSHHNSFLIFHTGEYVHEPYSVDKRYVYNFLEEGLESKIGVTSEAVRALTSEKFDSNKIRNTVRKINRGMVKLTKDELNYLIACYDAGINYVDDFVGKIYEILREESREYLFVLMADHGQAFLEHGRFGHGYSLYDEVIKVPLIIDYSNKYSLKVTETVQLMDLFPTICDILGYRINFKIDGTSFASVFNKGELKERIAVSEGYPYLSIRNKNYKLISTYTKFWSYRELRNRFGKDKDSRTKSWRRDLLALYLRFISDRLYCIKKDKEEKVNLRWKEKKIYSSLRFRLKNILTDVLQDSLLPEEVVIDNEVKKQLENLGYL